MVKLRNACYCNLKLMLIFFVILGHFIEPEIWADEALQRLYRCIYLFHMPLFSFLSGLFLRSSRDCLRQLRRMAPLYLGCQSLPVLLGLVPWHTPLWTLWYLLSLCFWLLLSALFLRWDRLKWPIFAVSVAAGCLAGLIPEIGRPLSLSRTIVFFPYFWLGVILKPDIPWHRFRIPGLLALGAVMLARPAMAVTDLYHAGPCDPLLRLECYVLAAALGLFLLSWCPRRRFPWTRAGADTLPAYLLHGPVTVLLRPVAHPAIASILLLYIIHKATQWHHIFGITGKEGDPWPVLKTYTRPRASRSTGSSWP